MLRYSFTDNAGEAHRDGVADVSPNFSEMYWFVWRYKLVVSWEGLEQSSLPKRNRTILFRVPKPPITKPIALRRHSWCGLIPLHAPIN